MTPQPGWPESALMLIGGATCVFLLFKVISWLIGKRVEKYLLDSSWWRFRRDIEYNHKQLEYRVDRLEKK
jgi:hypothetical protein